MEMAQLQVAKAQVELMDTQNKSLKNIENRQLQQEYKKSRSVNIDWTQAPINFEN